MLPGEFKTLTVCYKTNNLAHFILIWLKGAARLTGMSGGKHTASRELHLMHNLTQVAG